MRVFNNETKGAFPEASMQVFTHERNVSGYTPDEWNQAVADGIDNMDSMAPLDASVFSFDEKDQEVENNIWRPSIELEVQQSNEKARLKEENAKMRAELEELKRANKSVNEQIQQQTMESRSINVSNLLSGAVETSKRKGGGMKKESKAREDKAKEQTTKKPTTKKPKKQTINKQSKKENKTKEVVMEAKAVEIIDDKLNESVRSNASTVTDAGMENFTLFHENELEESPVDNKSDDDDDDAVVVDIKKGFVRKKTGIYLLNIQYTNPKDRIIEVELEAALNDDQDHKVLKWIMENKKHDIKWRDAATTIINKLSQTPDSQYADWIDWETYVKTRVVTKFLAPECLTIFEDGGGKNRGTKCNNYSIEDPVSPLKIKTKPCNVHCFKEEVKKQYARRGTGWALDDVMCQGYDGHECGREFVESLCDAKVPEKAIIPGMATPAMWCSVCKLVMCKECYGVYLNVMGTNKRRRIQMK
jgi:hypothetical protein